MPAYYGFAYDKHCLDYLKTLDKKCRRQIVTKIQQLAANPHPATAKVVQGMVDGTISFRDPWPMWWDSQWDKRLPRLPKIVKEYSIERIRELEKAGALIAAEIDRLLRKCKA